MWRKAEEFNDLFYSKENWLTKRIQQSAKTNVFHKFDDTSQQEWQALINLLTESLAITAKSVGLTQSEFLTNKFSIKDCTSIFNYIGSTLSRSGGVTISESMVLLKLFRKTYLDLVCNSLKDGMTNTLYCTFLERFFDRFELEFLARATGNSKSTVIPEQFSSDKEYVNNNKKYISALDNFFAPIILFDHEDNLLRINKEAARLLLDFRRSENQQRNKSFTEQVVNLFQLQITEFRHAVKDNSSYQTSLITSDGAKQYNVLLKKVLDENNCFEGTLVMLQDITEQLETEMHLQGAKDKAEEADKLKTAFLANMSHEIRTPMNAILGFTELMLNEKFDNNDRTEYLKLIRKSCNALLNIIEDIIDIAKIESKQLKIKYKPCKPFEVVSDLKAVFNETMRRYGINKDVELLLQVDKSEQDIIFYTDGERLKQVVSNLLSNAVKFTDHGSIKFGYKKIDQSNIFFFVRDTGMGIPDTMKDKIFERFFQLEKTQSLNVGGSGLGLAICKNIIQLLGGKIWVDSTEGIGSDFFFQIPCREVPKNSSDVENAAVEIKDCPDWSDKQFLIAEDDEINYLFLKEILAKTGVGILRAKNGLEAINMAEAEDKIDLILMDIKMPEVDGLEAAKYITTIRPELPIIAQTAYAMEGDMIKCSKAGCSAYITKPVDRQKLFSLIHRHIELHHKVREQSSLY